MRLTTLLLGFTLSLFSFSALAGSDHDHGHDHGDNHSHSHTPVDQEKASTNATKIVAALVKRNTLDNSWISITPSSVEKKTIKGNPEWLAIFDNEKASDPEKRKLYVFLTLGGDYIAANFTGN